MPKVFIVLVGGGKDNLGFPPIWAAARVYGTALRMHADRIRVELAGGVRVAEFPLGTVERFIRQYRLALQPDRVAKQGPDYEIHRPMWAVGRGGK